MHSDTLNHFAGLSSHRLATGARLSLASIPLVKTLAAWHGRAKQRHHLLALDDRLLSDIGISRAQAEVEAGKPFWKA